MPTRPAARATRADQAGVCAGSARVDVAQQPAEDVGAGEDPPEFGRPRQDRVILDGVVRVDDRVNPKPAGAMPRAARRDSPPVSRKRMAVPIGGSANAPT